YDETGSTGIHYHLDLLTPYWDPEGGARIDATYTVGLADLEADHALQQLTAEASFVKFTPDLTTIGERLAAAGFSPMADGRWPMAVLRWLSDTKWAFRAYGAVGLPNRAEYFPLGGSELLRGFDLAQRQGSIAWVASAE